jgi:N-methylhydantoinase B/oxoprolinase/acetone carboxylase alpha subunit
MASGKAEADPILLSLFAARFMSVAEAMGRSLQQTSISTNIKERLDFSCALFSPDGGLVANAPHLPVHLGSMSFAVRYQIARLKEGKHGGDEDEDTGINKGDVILANHPSAGGSHLPDITCITPVFDEEGKEIIFFTASRGHHAGECGLP